MKTMAAGMVVAGLLAFTGCGKGPTGGGGTSGGTFEMVPKGESVSIIQGQEEGLSIDIKRKSGYKEDVNMSAVVDDGKEDTGLSVSFSSKTVSGASTDPVVMNIKAGDKAKVGDHHIKVTATPAKGDGKPITKDVKVVVKDKNTKKDK